MTAYRIRCHNQLMNCVVMSRDLGVKQLCMTYWANGRRTATQERTTAELVREAAETARNARMQASMMGWMKADASAQQRFAWEAWMALWQAASIKRRLREATERSQMQVVARIAMDNTQSLLRLCFAALEEFLSAAQAERKAISSAQQAEEVRNRKLQESLLGWMKTGSQSQMRVVLREWFMLYVSLAQKRRIKFMKEKHLQDMMMRMFAECDASLKQTYFGALVEFVRASAAERRNVKLAKDAQESKDRRMQQLMLGYMKAGSQAQLQTTMGAWVALHRALVEDRRLAMVKEKGLNQIATRVLLDQDKTTKQFFFTVFADFRHSSIQSRLAAKRAQETEATKNQRMQQLMLGCMAAHLKITWRAWALVHRKAMEARRLAAVKEKGLNQIVVRMMLDQNIATKQLIFAALAEFQRSSVQSRKAAEVAQHAKEARSKRTQHMFFYSMKADSDATLRRTWSPWVALHRKQAETRRLAAVKEKGLNQMITRVLLDQNKTIKQMFFTILVELQRSNAQYRIAAKRAEDAEARKQQRMQQLMCRGNDAQLKLSWGAWTGLCREMTEQRRLAAIKETGMNKLVTRVVLEQKKAITQICFTAFVEFQRSSKQERVAAQLAHDAEEAKAQRMQQVLSGFLKSNAEAHIKAVWSGWFATSRAMAKERRLSAVKEKGMGKMLARVVAERSRALTQFFFSTFADIQRSAKAERQAEEARNQKLQDLMLGWVKNDGVARVRSAFGAWLVMLQAAREKRKLAQMKDSRLQQTLVHMLKGQQRSLRQFCFGVWMDYLRGLQQSKLAHEAEEAQCRKRQEMLLKWLQSDAVALQRLIFGAFIALQQAAVEERKMNHVKKQHRMEYALQKMMGDDDTIRHHLFVAWANVWRSKMQNRVVAQLVNDMVQSDGNVLSKMVWRAWTELWHAMIHRRIHAEAKDKCHKRVLAYLMTANDRVLAHFLYAAWAADYRTAVQKRDAEAARDRRLHESMCRWVKGDCLALQKDIFCAWVGLQLSVAEARRLAEEKEKHRQSTLIRMMATNDTGMKQMCFDAWTSYQRTVVDERFAAQFAAEAERAAHEARLQELMTGFISREAKATQRKTWNAWCTSWRASVEKRRLDEIKDRCHQQTLKRILNGLGKELKAICFAVWADLQRVAAQEKLVANCVRDAERAAEERAQERRLQELMSGFMKNGDEVRQRLAFSAWASVHAASAQERNVAAAKDGCHQKALVQMLQANDDAAKQCCFRAWVSEQRREVQERLMSQHAQSLAAAKDGCHQKALAQMLQASADAAKQCSFRAWVNEQQRVAKERLAAEHARSLAAALG
eukprot:TRINITY_DN1957_c0_g1_i5.p1 TRINITY_DN1957_c0_g1~~TRINITY_DN1957_c0_g1_i5.p1  ORF type:complete len:1446 (-),score=217.13 TRINITY_DN1957_c0_g1_i5:488-4417(-)